MTKIKDLLLLMGLSAIKEKLFVVPAHKASNNIVFVCKKHFSDCLIKDFGIKDTSRNRTYTITTLSYEGILVNHRSVLSPFGIYTKDA